MKLFFRQLCLLLLLANFTAVSVRESSAINLASKLGAKAEQVLDPTLLLGKDGFDKILKGIENVDAKYLAEDLSENENELFC